METKLEGLGFDRRGDGRYACGCQGALIRHYLEKALDVIEERYGSLEGYLEKEIGITEEKRFRLREMYLEA